MLEAGGLVLLAVVMSLGVYLLPVLGLGSPAAFLVPVETAAVSVVGVVAVSTLGVVLSIRATLRRLWLRRLLEGRC